MAEEENGLDLNLSLSLSVTPEKRQNPPPLPPPPPPPTRPSPFLMNLLNSKLPSSAARNAGTGFLVGGMHANRAMRVTAGKDVIISSGYRAVSSLIGNKRNDREENDGERALSSSLEMEEDGGDTVARKKLRLTKEQAALLEGAFKDHNALNPQLKMALAKQLNLKTRQVEVWFQNRRARTKLKQTEVDCEYLKVCYDNLTKQNLRLQKEVNELRALKLSPHIYMNNSPPTTLSMCPQCQRVVSSANPSSASYRAAPNQWL